MTLRKIRSRLLRGGTDSQRTGDLADAACPQFSQRAGELIPASRRGPGDGNNVRYIGRQFGEQRQPAYLANSVHDSARNRGVGSEIDAARYIGAGEIQL